jgi:NADH dehydrogenase/NADH:ubiquinone oxidoreductase subunit G
MSADVTLTIDGRSVTVPAGTTILAAAATLDIHIPTVCYHPHLTANGLCRVCTVEVERARVLQAACVAQVAEGMVVHTDSERVQRGRRTIAELLHAAVDCSEAADVQAVSAATGADPERFAGGERREPAPLDDNPMYVRDYAKCILCWRCVQVCAQDAQYTYAINFSGRGFHTAVATFFDAPMPETTCVFCGQCVQACPTGALKPRRTWLLEQGFTPDTIVDLSRGDGAGRRRRRRG